MNDLILLVDNEITLKTLSVNDAEKYFQLTDQYREYMRKWLIWVDKSHSVENIRKYLQEDYDKFQKNESRHFGIWYKEEFVGAVGFDAISSEHRKSAIGYWLGQPFQGKGIMTRCVKFLIPYAFEQLKLHRVELHIAEDNQHSRAVAERLGFKNECILRDNYWLNDRFISHVIYAMLETDERNF